MTFTTAAILGMRETGGRGILLLYDMDNRMVYLDTAGDAQKLITDDEVEEILDEVMKYFPGDPYKSTQAFFEAAQERAVNSWVANNIEGYYNEEKGMYITEDSSRRGSYWQRITRPAALLRSFLIAAAAAGVTVLCMLLSCRTGHTGGVNAYQKGPPKSMPELTGSSIQQLPSAESKQTAAAEGEAAVDIPQRIPAAAAARMAAEEEASDKIQKND